MKSIRIFAMALATMGVIHIVATFTPLINGGLELLSPAKQQAMIYMSLMCGMLLIVCGLLIAMLHKKVKEHPFLRRPYMLIYGALSVDGIAAVAFVGLREFPEWNDFVAQWFGIYESLLCVFISFGLLWLFREYGNWNSKFWQWCAAQAYGAYIVHLLLMIALQYAVDGIWMGAFGKFMFIGVVTTIASFGLTWLLRMILSVKKVL